jgi:hypothetical protein
VYFYNILLITTLPNLMHDSIQNLLVDIQQKIHIIYYVVLDAAFV